MLQAREPPYARRKRERVIISRPPVARRLVRLFSTGAVSRVYAQPKLFASPKHVPSRFFEPSAKRISRLNGEVCDRLHGVRRRNGSLLLLRVRAAESGPVTASTANGQRGSRPDSLTGLMDYVSRAAFPLSDPSGTGPWMRLIRIGRRT